MEIVRTELDLRRLRYSDGELHTRYLQRQQIEAVKIDLDASNSHFVALKYELSKTQVSYCACCCGTSEHFVFLFLE